jgi:pilus assembly protein Flp/PilA
MKMFVLQTFVKVQNWLAREEGQDLVEYALVVALIAFSAVAAMSTLASDINSIFVSLGSELTAATS